MPRDRRATGAEGATAPETLRQKDRKATALWKAGILRASCGGLTEGVNRRVPAFVGTHGESFRSEDRGGACDAGIPSAASRRDEPCRRILLTETALKRTPLHALHVELGARDRTSVG